MPIDPGTLLLLQIFGRLLITMTPELIALIKSDAEITDEQMQPIKRFIIEERIRIREGLEEPG